MIDRKEKREEKEREENKTIEENEINNKITHYSFIGLNKIFLFLSFLFFK